LLTTGVSLVQLFVERALDLDRPATQNRLTRFLPWYRAPMLEPDVAQPITAPQAPSDDAASTAAPVKTSRADRTRRSASLTSNDVVVDVSGLYKAYTYQPVLAGVDLTVRIGEVVALLGPSGSGKSTLLRCINHLEGWDAGIVKVGGRRMGFREDGKPLSPRALAEERASVGVGMVFQQFNLFGHLTALENVAGPLRWVHGLSRAEADRRARELLERVGLSDRADALPRHLSGGQQQRVAIARAIAPNPTVLLLDEPTSALDPELVNEVLEVIRRLAVEDGLTMVISTHQLRFADEVADRVVFLSGGSIIEEGPAHEVLTRPRHPTTARFLSVMEAENPGAAPA
jgi:polar amino acid transport system permease protein